MYRGPSGPSTFGTTVASSARVGLMNSDAIMAMANARKNLMCCNPSKSANRHCFEQRRAFRYHKCKLRLLDRLETQRAVDNTPSLAGTSASTSAPDLIRQRTQFFAMKSSGNDAALSIAAWHLAPSPRVRSVLLSRRAGLHDRAEELSD